ncbi:MAG: hypothetical protein IJO09_04095 [Oscillospiraceae bacterium]|nr:hypothetical protein [Oscillospiraceae bacterium]
MDNPTATAKKDYRVRMLLILLITFMCFSFLPLFTLDQLGGINLYATDAIQLSFMGIEFPEMANGEIVNFAEELSEETLEKLVETETLTREEINILRMSDEELDKFDISDQKKNDIIKKGIVAFLAISFEKTASDIERVLIPMLNQIRTPLLLVFFMLVVILVLFIVMMIAAAKNSKFLFRIAVLANLAVILILGFGAAIALNIDIGSFVGTGTITTSILLFLCLFIPFISKKNT